MTPRFFVDEDVADEIVLRGDHAHQIANVLRLKAGEEITLVRNGVQAHVLIESVSATEVRGRCVAKQSVDAEPRVRLTLALPILRGDRTEEVIEAVTQLEHEAVTVSLGPRNLRSETAAIAAVAQLMAILER